MRPVMAIFDEAFTAIYKEMLINVVKFYDVK